MEINHLNALLKCCTRMKLLIQYVCICTYVGMYVCIEFVT